MSKNCGECEYSHDTINLIIKAEHTRTRCIVKMCMKKTSCAKQVSAHIFGKISSASLPVCLRMCEIRSKINICLIKLKTRNEISTVVNNYSSESKHFK